MSTPIDPEKFPEMKSIRFETPEDASKMADVLNEIFSTLEKHEKKIAELSKLPDYKNWSVGPMG